MLQCERWQGLSAGSQPPEAAGTTSSETGAASGKQPQCGSVHYESTAPTACNKRQCLIVAMMVKETIFGHNQDKCIMTTMPASSMKTCLETPSKIDARNWVVRIFYGRTVRSRWKRQETVPWMWMWRIWVWFMDTKYRNSMRSCPEIMLLQMSKATIVSKEILNFIDLKFLLGLFVADVHAYICTLRLFVLNSPTLALWDSI